VLRESWERGVPLFSSSMLHVKKGVLFALYPNNVGLGRDLAALALGPEPRTPGLAPLRAVRLAFNIRTASHIGLRVDAEQQRSFSAVFP
jgi:putative ABC transport system substrate-binding protein